RGRRGTVAGAGAATRVVARAGMKQCYHRRMLELVQAGGWLMLPIILSSIIAAGIVAERLWFLQRDRVIPPNLVSQVRQRIAADQLDGVFVDAVRRSSPLGRVIAAGLAARDAPRDVVKENVEDTGRHVVHELGRYLN